MSTARRTRGRGHEDDAHDEPDERWAVSYADMVTVLMCLFIVLFAVSNVDKTKFELLANSLATGFGQESTEGGADTAEGIVVPEELQDDDGVVDLTARAEAEFESLEQLRDRMTASLATQGLQDTVQFVIDDRGLQVGLVGAETFFADNSTELSAKADSVLDAIGDVLTTVDNQVSVEGHADHRVSALPFPTNWELSGGRATQVARFLVEHEGVGGPRVKATAYSDTRPIAQGDSPQALASNRRVDIVVESTEAEQVRALIPAIAAASKD
ncbi:MULTISPECIES: flagellar motor protein MotB [Microbacterium]|uniref:OmpA/MotB family protein n=1 Tax=Microbacterium TaxID=33882 RepID=UPI0011ED765E|nr:MULTISPECIES: flagellar motor protein MotB [Microbacterium]KAA0960844.1 OmpA family protein [Microbacterium sp. ANT_H45B]MCP1430086.1 chemotaxis protein MotB [Microbacterium foliorum]